MPETGTFWEFGFPNGTLWEFSHFYFYLQRHICRAAIAISQFKQFLTV